ncbi:hypothetical protein [Lelliottia wanjuensis]|uniref:hypothetical protein n=1 Tax=Lelliottia wanjuensis TaxID=3050585 RepID=UPI00254E16E7|nr:hypothetical protein [Lelliottia sp. V104_15]MDK9607090.1 hypothetical protein [Lelliottia sp. V104_15]
MGDIQRIKNIGAPSSFPSGLADSYDDDEIAPSKKDQLSEQTIKDRETNRELRIKFAGRAYLVAYRGLIFWGCLCVFYMIGDATGLPIIHDDVMIAITTATTLNLCAAFLGVIKGLFPSGIPEN